MSMNFDLFRMFVHLNVVSSENCVKSIINVFHIAWTKESALNPDERNKKIEKGQESESKKELAVCIAFFR